MSCNASVWVWVTKPWTTDGNCTPIFCVNLACSATKNTTNVDRNREWTIAFIKLQMTQSLLLLSQLCLPSNNSLLLLWSQITYEKKNSICLHKSSGARFCQDSTTLQQAGTLNFHSVNQDYLGTREWRTNLVVNVSSVQFENEAEWPRQQEEVAQPENRNFRKPRGIIRGSPTDEGFLKVNVRQIHPFSHFHVVIVPLLLLQQKDYGHIWLNQNWQ